VVNTKATGYKERGGSLEVGIENPTATILLGFESNQRRTAVNQSTSRLAAHGKEQMTAAAV